MARDSQLTDRQTDSRMARDSQLTDRQTDRMAQGLTTDKQTDTDRQTDRQKNGEGLTTCRS